MFMKTLNTFYYDGHYFSDYFCNTYLQTTFSLVTMSTNRYSSCKHRKFWVSKLNIYLKPK